MSKASFTLVVALSLTLGSATLGAQTPPTDEQIAAALQAAPQDRKEEAGVLGFDDSGKLVTLREASNDLICLADTPGDDRFSVACYHEDLEPYMARGRELREQGVTGMERNTKRWEEIEAGTLPIPREPRTLYVVTGESYDAQADEVTGRYERWVLYVPFATAESTGLPTQPAESMPWLMFPGTAGAHIMISPPQE